MKHALTVDMEDWYQAAITHGGGGDPSPMFERNVDCVLQALADHDVRATFFVLGMGAEKAKALVRRVADAGHEIQNHGFGHKSNFILDADAFREDLLRGKKLLEDLTGQEIYGYRSPYFSIDERNLWTLDVLLETGHRYDSSVFPMTRSCIVDIGADTYGIEGFPPEPQILTSPGGGKILEIPVSCVDWLGKRWPIGGGGYFRLWPFAVIRFLWKRLQKRGHPGVVYMHPYEYDPTEVQADRVNVSWKRRLHQTLGRKRFPRKIDRLLRRFDFGAVEDVLADLLAQVE